MKLYTFYSDSHLELYENFFIKSFKENSMEKSFDLISLKVDQKSSTGDFNSDGFNSTMVDKVEIILQAINDNWGEPFMFCDCDIQFLRDFKQDILSYLDDKIDLYAQSDAGTICAGFLMVKANKISKKFIEKIIKETPKFSNDQVCMNYYKNHIRYKLLPEDKYFTIASANNAKVWNGEENFQVPSGILVHHANYTIGISNKKKLMELVKKNVIHD